MPSNNNVNIKVKVDDREAKKEINSLKKSFASVGDSLKTTKIGKAFEDIKSKAGGLGNALKALGPSGVGGAAEMSLAGLAGALGATAAAFAAVAVAAAGATAAMVAVANKTAEYADNVNKASQRMGVSLEFYQKMKSAAEHSGTGINTMVVGMRTMVRTIEQVNDGNKRATDTFNRLGVSLRDNEGNLRSQEDIFKDVLISLSKMKNETERNALAQKVLGKSASELAPLFNEGAKAVDNYINKNDEAVRISKEMAKASAKYNDELQRVQEKLLKAVNKGLTPFMEEMASMMEDLSDSASFDGFLSFLEDSARLLLNAAQAAHDFQLAIDWMNGGEEKALADQQKWADVGVKIQAATKLYKKYEEDIKKGSKRDVKMDIIKMEDLIEGYKKTAKAAGVEQETIDKTVNLLQHKLDLMKKGETYSVKEYQTHKKTNKELKKANKLLKERTYTYNIKVGSADIDESVMSTIREYLAETQIIPSKEETKQKLLDTMNVVESTFASFTPKTKTNSFISFITGDMSKFDAKMQEIKDKYSASLAEIQQLQKDSLSKNKEIYDIRLKNATTDLDKLKKKHEETGSEIAKIEAQNGQKLTKKQIDENNARLAALRIQYANEQRAITESQESIYNIKQEQTNKELEIKKEALDAEVQLEKEKAAKIKEIQDKSNKIEMVQGAFKAMQQIASTTLDMFDSFNQLAVASDQKKLEDMKKNHHDELSSLVVTDRRKKQIADKQAKEEEKLQDKIKEKEKKGRIASVWMGALSSIPQIWGGLASAFAKFGTAAVPLTISFGSLLTGMVLASAGAQAAAIAKYATGGIVPGNSYYGDKVPAMVNSGEMILNRQQQLELFKKISEPTEQTQSNINVNIESFSGNDDDLQRLEDMLHELRDNNRLVYA